MILFVRMRCPWLMKTASRAVPIILFFLPIILFRISHKMLLLFPGIVPLFSIYSHQKLSKVYTHIIICGYIYMGLLLFLHQELVSQARPSYERIKIRFLDFIVGGSGSRPHQDHDSGSPYSQKSSLQILW